MNSIKSRWGVVQTPPDEDKSPGLSEKCSQNTLSGGLPVSGNNPFRKLIPLTLVFSWHTPYFLLLPYYLAYNRLSHVMILTSITLVSSWGGEVSNNLDLATVIGYPPFNTIHLTLHLIPLWLQNLPHIAFPKKLIKTFPLTLYKYWPQFVLVQPHKFFWGSSYIFFAI